MTTLEALGAALVLGVATLPHCLAMCGPVAALHRAGPTCGSWRSARTYLAGRLVGYMVVGSLMGALGAHAFAALGGRWLGRAAIAALAVTCAWQAYRALRPSPPLVKLRSQPRASWADTATSLLPQRGLGLGVATAVFPCGALPAAWGIAAAAAHPARGAAAMLAFALASSPALVLGIFGRQLLGKLGARVPRALQAAGWLAVAALLCARLWHAREGSCHG
jgi:hypothetical protein